MKKVLFILTLFFVGTVHAQDSDQWNSGNGTFSLSVKGLQKYFLHKTTLKKFEKTLALWQHNTQEDDVTHYLDSTPTKIVTRYYNQEKNGKTTTLYVTHDTAQKINSIRYILVEDELRVNKIEKFVKELRACGYTYDIGTTRLRGAFGERNTIICRHPASRIFISIRAFNDGNRYSIEFSK